MLISYPTQRGTGILLEGDYYDMHALYWVVHAVAGALERPETDSQYMRLLGLAYEVRHCYQGDRQQRRSEDAGTYYGFKYNWPDMLVATNLLRRAASLYHPGRTELAMLAWLEACVEKALSLFDAEGAQGLTGFIGTGINTEGPLFCHLADSLTGYYLNQRATKARFRELPQLLNDFLTPSGEAYQQVTQQVRAAAAHHRCSLQEIQVNNWPEKLVW